MHMHMHMKEMHQRLRRLYMAEVNEEAELL
jgi:hypothetical protein